MFSHMKKQLTALALICSFCLTTYGKINEEQFFNSLAKIESSGNPNAVNRLWVFIKFDLLISKIRA